MGENLAEQLVGVCTGCGQHIRLPHELSAQVACPRCGRACQAVDLLPPKPIAAVPVEPSDSMAATVVQLPAFVVEGGTVKPVLSIAQPQ